MNQKRFFQLGVLNKIAMPRPYGSIFDLEVGGFDDEDNDFDSEPVTDDEKGYMRRECEGSICWYGNRDRMIKVDADYIYPIEGNMFYGGLVSRIEQKINRATRRNPVELLCGWGRISKVDIDDIELSIQDREMDRSHNVLTTGDEEIDLYLEDKESYLENGSNLYTEEEAEERIKEIVEHSEGDCGKYIFKVRDGNHRSFAAKRAGEKYIWINLEMNQYNDLKNDEYGVYENYSEIKKQLGFNNEK